MRLGSWNIHGKKSKNHFKLHHDDSEPELYRSGTELNCHTLREELVFRERFKVYGKLARLEKPAAGECLSEVVPSPTAKP